MLKKCYLTAFIIALFAAVICLSQLTKDARIHQAEKTQWGFLQATFADKILSVELQDNNETAIYQVTTEQENAWLIFTEGRGFSSNINLAIIFDVGLQLKQVLVLHENESLSYTKGLNHWLDQLSQTWNTQNIDQLSGATVSSRAVTQQIEQAQNSLLKWLDRQELNNE